MNLFRSWILSTHSRVHLLVPYHSLTLLTFSEDDENIADPYSVWIIGMYVSLRHEVVLISYEARLMAYFSERYRTHSTTCPPEHTPS